MQQPVWWLTRSQWILLYGDIMVPKRGTHHSDSRWCKPPMRHKLQSDPQCLRASDTVTDVNNKIQGPRQLTSQAFSCLTAALRLTLRPLGYFCNHGPLGGGGGQKDSTSRFYISDQRSINLVCMCRSTNYLWICTSVHYVWLFLLAIWTISMVNFVNKLQKKWKDIPSPTSTILIKDRQIWYVCVDRQLLTSQLPFYPIFD